MGEYLGQFKEVTLNQSIDEQAMTFLKAFVAEFQGNFEEVLELAEEFKTFALNMQGHVRELDEFEAHRFLEQRGETKTVKDMRQELQEIDVDSNHKLAFIEFLLFKYKKTVKDLFTAKPNAALVAKLEAAIRQYKAVFEEKKAREEQMNALEQRANAGDVKAKAELRRLEMHDPGSDAKNEMQALQAKLAAKRALRNPQEEEDKLYQQEQARLAEEKQKKEDEERRKRDESRAKLKARAALWS